MRAAKSAVAGPGVHADQDRGYGPDLREQLEGAAQVFHAARRSVLRRVRRVQGREHHVGDDHRSDDERKRRPKERPSPAQLEELRAHESAKPRLRLRRL
jgi:hypothetical protein